jgi:hypothetical protein
LVFEGTVEFDRTLKQKRSAEKRSVFV